ncbi:MAG: P-II family nitrogen regulator [Bacillota bacterium]
MPHRDAIVFMVVIVNRTRGERLAELFAKEGVTFHLLALGRGTADRKLLAYLGLGETEKEILFSAMPKSTAVKLLKMLDCECSLHLPGKGIAFCVGISAYADAASRTRLYGACQIQGGEPMEQAYRYDLIIAVTNQGYADEVMDTAKAAGAPGGTVLHARGVGMKHAEKFFGITIHPEKEMLLILAQKEHCQGIMTAIVEKSGLKTDAKTIAFALPVSAVAGLPFGAENCGQTPPEP